MCYLAIVYARLSLIIVFLLPDVVGAMPLSSVVPSVLGGPSVWMPGGSGPFTSMLSTSGNTSSLSACANAGMSANFPLSFAGVPEDAGFLELRKRVDKLCNKGTNRYVLGQLVDVGLVVSYEVISFRRALGLPDWGALPMALVHAHLVELQSFLKKDAAGEWLPPLLSSSSPIAVVSRVNDGQLLSYLEKQLGQLRSFGLVHAAVHLDSLVTRWRHAVASTSLYTPIALDWWLVVHKLCMLGLDSDVVFSDASQFRLVHTQLFFG